MKRHVRLFESFEPAATDQDREARRRERRKSMRGMFGPEMTPLEKVRDIVETNGQMYGVVCSTIDGKQLVAFGAGRDNANEAGKEFLDDLMARDSFDHIGRIDPSDVYELEPDTPENVIVELETMYFGSVSIDPMIKKLEEEGYVKLYYPEHMWDITVRVMANLERLHDEENQWDEDYDEEEDEEDQE